MIFIDQTQVDLSLLNPANPTGGRKFTGKSEIEARMASKWQELFDKYGFNGTVTFVRPHMKSGMGSGTMGGSYTRSVHINTPNGTKTVTWCDSALPQGNGMYNFLPKKFTHEPSQSLVLQMGKDIEQILWHLLFDPLRERKHTYPALDLAGKPHPKAGKAVDCIYLLDPNDDAVEYLKNSTRSADMWFYLASAASPIAAKRDVINMLASAWGVFKPEDKSDAIVKQMLIQTIETAEATGDKERYGYEAFGRAVADMLSGEDTTMTETLALISKATDRGIIKYMSTRLCWILQSENGTEIKRLTTVPASQATKPKEVLADYLLRSDEDMTLIQGSVEAKPIKEKAIKKVYIPANPTADFFTTQVPFPKMVAICNIIGIDHFNKKKIELSKVLIDHFVTKKLSIPAEYLLEEPDETI